jgi:SAM-dependent methyltransferase
MARDELQKLLDEQVAYYRARAGEYDASAPWEVEESSRARLIDALRTFGPRGRVLELACGTGVWTEELAARCDQLTALDASPEMLEIASRRLAGRGVRFIQADIFGWHPDRTYDVVFFGFWLSHVPLERFESFWSMVAACLGPAGRVLFVDDAFRTDDELIEGPDSTTIRRRLNDGTAYRAVKVPHTPASLERRIADLGWRIAVEQMPGPFFCGTGSPP